MLKYAASEAGRCAVYSSLAANIACNSYCIYSAGILFLKNGTVSGQNVNFQGEPMIIIEKNGVFLKSFNPEKAIWSVCGDRTDPDEIERNRRGTMAYGILAAHNTSGSERDLKLRFDAMASHDITYVGIIQTARASGLKEFPLPYIMTNCHNSLCAVGGTINEDDHIFGLSGARRYGGDFVPAHQAVIHQYMREMWAGCGKMILGSDSHTRYGALGTLAIGEGGPELVKQLLNCTYDITYPEVAAVYLSGRPRPGVGPQDVALALIKAVFADGLAKNRILEFVGPGVAALSVEYRMGIDVMTTETTCLSSIWQTDEKIAEYLSIHGRVNDYARLAPTPGAYYDMLISIDLGAIEPMIALPFHPSNAYPVRVFKENAADLLRMVEKEAGSILGPGVPRSSLQSKLRGGSFFADQAVIAGCAGGSFENICQAARVLKGSAVGSGAFGLSVYPASQPQYLELVRNGAVGALMESGATMHTAFCGPCFGAGDVPGHNAFSLRHTTRNFPNREGSKPGAGQISYVALMDARSIAATALNKGRLTSALEVENFPAEPQDYNYRFSPIVYAQRVYHGWGKPDPDAELIFGPNIADWPSLPPLPENLLLTVGSAIYDPVTTTDELIPSGETSSYRSNPMKLAEFTLSRKDPAYVGRAKSILRLEMERRELKPDEKPGAELAAEMESLDLGTDASVMARTGLGSVVFAVKPGDGSAREQAASCQRVLGGCANVAVEYATKRYRSNLINWGMLPFILPDWPTLNIQPGDKLYVPHIRQALLHGLEKIPAVLQQNTVRQAITLELPILSADEKRIILDGCLINNYAEKNGSCRA